MSQIIWKDLSSCGMQGLYFDRDARNAALYSKRTASASASAASGSHVPGEHGAPCCGRVHVGRALRSLPGHAKLAALTSNARNPVQRELWRARWGRAREPCCTCINGTGGPALQAGRARFAGVLRSAGALRGRHRPSAQAAAWRRFNACRISPHGVRQCPGGSRALPSSAAVAAVMEHARFSGRRVQPGACAVCRSTPCTSSTSLESAYEVAWEDARRACVISLAFELSRAVRSQRAHARKGSFEPSTAAYHRLPQGPWALIMKLWHALPQCSATCPPPSPPPHLCWVSGVWRRFRACARLALSGL